MLDVAAIDCILILIIITNKLDEFRTITAQQLTASITHPDHLINPLTRSQLKAQPIIELDALFPLGDSVVVPIKAAHLQILLAGDASRRENPHRDLTAQRQLLRIPEEAGRTGEAAKASVRGDQKGVCVGAREDRGGQCGVHNR
jgi:hypothetical protein